MEDEHFHTRTSSWSDSIEGTIRGIGAACYRYKWMNVFAAKKNQRNYNMLMYASIVIGPLAGVLSAVQAGNGTDTLALQTLVTLFSFLSGVISATIKFSEFSEKASAYKTTAAKYSSLESNIYRQLSLTRDDRVNAGEYLEWISVSYDELFSTSPLIADDVQTEWTRTTTMAISAPPSTAQGTAQGTAQAANTAGVAATASAQSLQTGVNQGAAQGAAQGVAQGGIPVSRTPKEIDIELDTRYFEGKLKYEMARLSRMK